MPRKKSLENSENNPPEIKHKAITRQLESQTNLIKILTKLNKKCNPSHRNTVYHTIAQLFPAASKKTRDEYIKYLAEIVNTNNFSPPNETKLFQILKEAITRETTSRLKEIAESHNINYGDLATQIENITKNEYPGCRDKQKYNVIANYISVHRNDFIKNSTDNPKAVSVLISQITEHFKKLRRQDDSYQIQELLKVEDQKSACESLSTIARELEKLLTEALKSHSTIDHVLINIDKTMETISRIILKTRKAAIGSNELFPILEMSVKMLTPELKHNLRNLLQLTDPKNLPEFLYSSVTGCNIVTLFSVLESIIKRDRTENLESIIKRGPTENTDDELLKKLAAAYQFFSKSKSQNNPTSNTDPDLYKTLTSMTNQQLINLHTIAQQESEKKPIEPHAPNEKPLKDTLSLINYYQFIVHNRKNCKEVLSLISNKAVKNILSEIVLFNYEDPNTKAGYIKQSARLLKLLLIKFSTNPEAQQNLDVYCNIQQSRFTLSNDHLGQFSATKEYLSTLFNSSLQNQLEALTKIIECKQKEIDTSITNTGNLSEKIRKLTNLEKEINQVRKGKDLEQKAKLIYASDNRISRLAKDKSITLHRNKLYKVAVTIAKLLLFPLTLYKGWSFFRHQTKTTAQLKTLQQESYAAPTA